MRTEGERGPAQQPEHGAGPIPQDDRGKQEPRPEKGPGDGRGEGSHLAETDPARMGQHTFGNLPSWEDFPGRVGAGDLVVTGANFGCGSSRQQAVTCFKSLGVSAILACSYGAIYERNAINDAMPVVTLDWRGGIETGDTLRVHLATGLVENLTRGTTLQARPLSKVELDIYRRVGLLGG